MKGCARGEDVSRATVLSEALTFRRHGRMKFGMPRSGAPLLVGLSFVGTACSLVVPEGPDLTALERSYTNPSGTLDEDNVGLLAETGAAAIQRVRSLGNLDFVVDALDSVTSAIQNFSESTQDEFEIDIVSDSRTACPGYRGASIHDETNGSLRFTLALEDSVVRPSLWGKFIDCRLEPGDSKIELDADVSVLIEGERALSDLDVTGYLFSIDGLVRFDGNVWRDGIDFRVLRDDAVEISVPSTDGNLILRLGETDDQTVVRTRALSYCCHFEARRCFEVSRDSCDSPVASGEELEW